MAQSLGSLYVDLQANTGGFVSAMAKAASEAQRTARAISESFSRIGEVASQTFGAFGDFNPVISKLSFAISAAGNTASFAMKNLNSLGGAMGSLASLGAGAAAGAAALGISALGLAAHAAEGAAKMYELAQSTGVAVPTLSGLSFAAKAVGVDMETLATGLERMSKSAFAAATAPAGATNAYSRLGISVRDAAGNIRPAEDLFLDLAHKFSDMPDGVEKTAAAMQIFGRGGAALIPVLNQGKQAIAEILDYAQRTGAILSGPAAEGAEQYERNVAKIGIAAQGAQNGLMVSLLPTLDYLSAMLAKTGADGKSWAQTTAGSFADLAKGVLSASDVIFHSLDEIGIFIEFVGHLIIGTLNMIGTVVTSLGHLFIFDFSGAENELKAGLHSFTSAFTDFWGESKQTWSDGVDFINGVWSKLKPPSFDMDRAINYLKNYGGSTKQAPAPTASHQPDVVSELVSKLQAEAAAQIALASATETSTSARLMNEAAAKAEEKISETRASLMAREKELQEQLNDAKAQAAAGVGSASASGTGGPGVQAAKIEAEIAGVRKLLGELQTDTPRIKSLYAEIASGEFGAKASKDLQEFITKTNEETSAARDMAAAYSQGGAAVQQAMEAAKLAPFEKQKADLAALIAGLKEIGAPAADVAKLQTAYDQLGSSIDRARAATAAFESAKISEEIGKEKEQLAAEAKAYDVVAAAAFSSLAAQREAAAQGCRRSSSAAEHPAATQDDLSSVHDVELAKLNEQYALTVRQEAAQLDLNGSYDREMEKLQAVKAVMEDMGESTLAVDAKIYEAQLQRIDTWDKEALEVGFLHRQIPPPQ